MDDTIKIDVTSKKEKNKHSESKSKGDALEEESSREPKNVLQNGTGWSRSNTQYSLLVHRELY
jgi:hypothetical protein